MRGLPAAALPEALSTLRHPLVLRFLLLSHEDSTAASLPTVKAAIKASNKKDLAF